MTAVHIAAWVILGLCIAVIIAVYYCLWHAAKHEADKE